MKNVFMRASLLVLPWSHIAQATDKPCPKYLIEDDAVTYALALERLRGIGLGLTPDRQSGWTKGLDDVPDEIYVRQADQSIQSIELTFYKRGRRLLRRTLSPCGFAYGGLSPHQLVEGVCSYLSPKDARGRYEMQVDLVIGPDEGVRVWIKSGDESPGLKLTGSLSAED